MFFSNLLEQTETENQKPDPRVRDDRQLGTLLAALGPDIYRGKVSAVNEGVKIMKLRIKLMARLEVTGGTDEISAPRPFEKLTDWDLNTLIDAYKNAPDQTDTEAS